MRRETVTWYVRRAFREQPRTRWDSNLLVKQVGTWMIADGHEEPQFTSIIRIASRERKREREHTVLERRVKAYVFIQPR